MIQYRIRLFSFPRSPCHVVEFIIFPWTVPHLVIPGHLQDPRRGVFPTCCKPLAYIKKWHTYMKPGKRLKNLPMNLGFTACDEGS